MIRFVLLLVVVAGMVWLMWHGLAATIPEGR